MTEGKSFCFEVHGGPWHEELVFMCRHYLEFALAGEGGKYVWNAKEERYDWQDDKLK